MQLPLLPQDKANHYVYGALISLVSALVVATFSSVWHPTKIGATVAFVAGLLKELSDAWTNYRLSGSWRFGPHGVEGADFLATFLGGLTVHLGSVLSS